MTQAPDPSPTVAPLYSPARVQQLLRSHGLRPTKSLGQNFLIDGNILRHIAQSGGAGPGVSVLEVGPGLGVLTRELCQLGARVITLEKDERLRPVLAETLDGCDVQIVWGDALEFDYAALPPGTRVIANLPYYITGPLLTAFMRAEPIHSATVLVQKEVAQRLAARPGDEAYGFLGALAQLYGQVQPLRDVPKGAFFPIPEVTSSLVRLDFDRQHQPPPAALVRFLDQVLSYRRKTLRNNLRLAGFEASEIERAFAELDLKPEVRADTVQLRDIEQLARVLGVLP